MKNYPLSIVILCLIIQAKSAFGAASDAQLTEVTVGSSNALYRAVANANRTGFTKIVIKSGYYYLPKTLQITNDFISLVSSTGNPDDVVLSGKGMKETRSVDNLIRVTGQHFTFSGITAQQAPNHIIQIAGEKNADYAVIENCILQDSYEQLVKISYNNASGIAADEGIIKNCTFGYTAGIGPQYYIGGVDMHGGSNWDISHNQFFGIASPQSRIAEHAIHLWNQTKNNRVSYNTIINCDRGIGFGMTSKPNFGGVIEHNTILHFASHPNADVGIIAELSPDTVITNNTIYLFNDYPNAIEYRYGDTTNVEVSHNTVNKRIAKRDGASAKVMDNQHQNTLSTRDRLQAFNAFPDSWQQRLALSWQQRQQLWQYKNL